MSGHDETIHPDYIPEDFRELLRMACDSVWEQGELYSEDLLLAAFKPAIDEHDRQIAEEAWEDGYIQALKNMGSHARRGIARIHAKPISKGERMNEIQLTDHLVAHISAGSDSRPVIKPKSAKTATSETSCTP